MIGLSPESESAYGKGKEMNKLKTITAAVLFAALCFGGGYFFGWLLSGTGEEEAPDGHFVEVIPTAQPEETAVAAAAGGQQTEAPEQGTYMIAVEDNKIRIYFRENGTRTLIKEEEYPVEVLPYEDRIQLSEGIETADMETALEVWEGFVS